MTNYPSPTDAFDPGDQAATLITPRNLDGQPFDGSADVLIIAPGTHAAPSKTTPADADEFPIVDSAASNVLKKLTWANLKATMLAYLLSDVPYELAAGEATMPRLNANGTVSATPGVARFAMFTARKTETITQVRTITVGAASGATLCRIGIFTVDAADNLTALVASTANDTAMWSSASTVYTKALTASFSKVRGTRYAVCLLQVGGSGATWVGNSTLSGLEAGIVPRLNGAMTAQTDLQPSVAVGSFASPNGASMPYAVLLP